jgi:hypothetical protein
VGTLRSAAGAGDSVAGETLSVAAGIGVWGRTSGGDTLKIGALSGMVFPGGSGGANSGAAWLGVRMSHR